MYDKIDTYKIKVSIMPMPEKHMDHRDIDDYVASLRIPKKRRAFLDNSAKEILLIGGGYGEVQKHIKAKITNVDISRPLADMSHNCARYVQGDFLEQKFKDQFEEAWALFSLPLYLCYEDGVAQLRKTTAFYAKALRALKPGGVLRVSPVFNDSVWFGDILTRDCGRVDMYNKNGARETLVIQVPEDPLDKGALNLKIEKYLENASDKGYVGTMLMSDIVEYENPGDDDYYPEKYDPELVRRIVALKKKISPKYEPSGMEESVLGRLAER